MKEELILGKLTLVITTRCNLKCSLCCEYVPQNKPFPDMTLDEEKLILDALFYVVDHVDILHLSGGGEPFLHKDLAEMIEIAFNYNDRFDRFMVFTNSTIPVSERLLEALIRHKDKLIVHASDYNISPKRTAEVYKMLNDNDISCRIIKYYGEIQNFGGWVDFGSFEAHKRTPTELERVFQNCAVTRDMHGNWRTRDGKVHWCSRSQRGMELGLIPDNQVDYVDLFDHNVSREEKKEKFLNIMQARYISACDHCSGEQGTDDSTKRHPAGFQIQGKI
jgi:organic radical activating enzyme